MYGSNWTTASVVSSSTGIPFKIPMNNMIFNSNNYLRNVKALGDVLKDNGYISDIEIYQYRLQYQDFNKTLDVWKKCVEYALANYELDENDIEHVKEISQNNSLFGIDLNKTIQDKENQRIFEVTEKDKANPQEENKTEDNNNPDNTIETPEEDKTQE